MQRGQAGNKNEEETGQGQLMVLLWPLNQLRLWSPGAVRPLSLVWQ